MYTNDVFVSDKNLVSPHTVHPAMAELTTQLAEIVYYADIFHVHLQFAFRDVIFQFCKILTIRIMLVPST